MGRHKAGDNKLAPDEAERAEALRRPGSLIYRVQGEYGTADTVPGEAIVGAWQVDESGKIVGDLIPNANFGRRPKLQMGEEHD